MEQEKLRILLLWRLLEDIRLFEWIQNAGIVSCVCLLLGALVLLVSFMDSWFEKAKKVWRQEKEIRKLELQHETNMVRIQWQKREIRELKEILPRKRQENYQLRQEIEELKRKSHLSKEREQAVKIENDNLRSQIESLQIDKHNLQQERDNLVREAEELRNHSGSSTALNSEFSLQELEQATQNFSESLKIGQGGFGSVYKGSFRQTTVAIKLLHSQSLRGISQFQQEVTILTKVRHPNVVTLIGACSEASALVYEYLSSGSLEDRLTRAKKTPPLTWQARTRIISEVCRALIFLHSNKPQLVVHGDLKPDNILLDANLVSKLGDFGISRLLNQPDTNVTAFLQTIHLAGTWPYMDPEYVSTGKLTPKSDIYSFGIIILRLLTGKPPDNIARKVQDAMNNGNLLSVIDKFAGKWPLHQAKRLAKIGLKCAQSSRSQRPDLAKVLAVAELLMKPASTVEP